MTRKRDTKPGDDICLQALQKSHAPAVMIVAKAWDMQVKRVLSTTLEENLRMVADSLRFFKGKRREVLFDAGNLIAPEKPHVV